MVPTFRSFKHGALHGTIMAVLFAFPIIRNQRACSKDEERNTFLFI
jgi:hypothetical protein